MNSILLSFSSVSTAAIIAGHRFEGEWTRAEWRKQCLAIDALAARTKQPIVVMLSGDLSHPDNAVGTGALVGLLVAASDDPEPLALPWENLREAQTRAVALPWPKIQALLGSPAQELHLWGASTGPLAGFYVALGVPALDESEQLEWTQGSPQSREPPLDFIAGKDMRQNRVERGIWGMRIAYGGDWEVEQLDVTPAAHEARLAKLGSLASEASYFLMASHD